MDRESAATQIEINRIVARVLTWGFIVCGTLVVAGLALTVARGDSLHTSLESIGDLFDELARGRGAGIVGLGIVAMIATPLVSALVVIFAFLRIGDRRYALITTAVLVILAISAALSAL